MCIYIYIHINREILCIYELIIITIIINTTNEQTNIIKYNNEYNTQTYKQINKYNKIYQLT